MAGTTGLEPATSAVTGQRSNPISRRNLNDCRSYTAEPHWINEPDWLCAVEFLNDDDPESRDFAADTIGYLLGYSQLTNTRSLALIGDPEYDGVRDFVFIFFSGREGEIPWTSFGQMTS